VIRLAWFSPEDYDLLLKATKSTDDFDSNFETWHAKAKKDVMKIVAGGQRIAKVNVDVKAFKKWCKEHKKPVDKESLDLFITLPPGE